VTEVLRSEADFQAAVAPLRRQLHAHCYRLLGSPHDAEDALQEALVRAWRAFAELRAPEALRSWLYTVATRTCLDSIERRGRRALPMDLGPASTAAVLSAPVTEVSWLEPYPSEPADRIEQRESVELAFVAALQHLPGNQRACLLLADVLSFSAAEIAEIMQTSVGAVTNSLQRARRNVAERVPDRSQQQSLRAAGDRRVRELVAGYADALERGDVSALLALVTDDVTWAMPPLPEWFAGRAGVAEFVRAVPMGSCGDWRHCPVTANGQPAVAGYLRPPGADQFGAWSINVLSVRDGRIAGVLSFIGAHHFAGFGLSPVLAG